MLARYEVEAFLRITAREYAFQTATAPAPLALPGETMKVTGKEYASIVSATGKSVVNFSAGWCPDCNVVSAIYGHLSGTLAKDISFFEVDVDEEPELEKAQGVKRIPTFIFFEDGKEVERFHEPSPKELAERILRFAGKA